LTQVLMVLMEYCIVMIWRNVFDGWYMFRRYKVFNNRVISLFISSWKYFTYQIASDENSQIHKNLKETSYTIPY
jgi:hypothetical protein